MNLFSLSISWRPFLLLLLHREICWQSSSPPTQSRFPISMRPSGQSIRQSPFPREKMQRIYGRVWGTVRKCDATADAYFSPGPKTFFIVQDGRASKSLFQGRFFSFFHVRSFILPFSLWLLLLFLLGYARNPSEARNWGITGPFKLLRNSCVHAHGVILEEEGLCTNKGPLQGGKENPIKGAIRTSWRPEEGRERDGQKNR